MKIDQVVVNLIADQLESYKANHPNFHYESEFNVSIFRACLQVLKDSLAGFLLIFQSFLFGLSLECPVCFDNENLIANFPCCHIICVSCGKRWFEEKIDRGATLDTLVCPSPGCSMTLSPTNAKLFLSEESFLRVRYNHYIRAISNISEEYKLACPQPDCPGFFIRFHTNPNSPGYDKNSAFASCPICFVRDIKSVYCFKCRKHHSKEEHYEMKNMVIYSTTKALKNWFGLNIGNETESEALVRKMKLTTKKCPSCGILCEKDEACNHCTCLNCGTEFNWAHERIWEGYSAEFKRNAVF